MKFWPPSAMFVFSNQPVGGKVWLGFATSALIGSYGENGQNTSHIGQSRIGYLLVCLLFYNYRPSVTVLAIFYGFSSINQPNMFRQFGLQCYKPGMVPGKRTPAPGPSPKAAKRSKTAEETSDSSTSKKTMTRHFQASWKWDDEEQKPCRHWLRHDPVKNLMYCDKTWGTYSKKKKN